MLILTRKPGESLYIGDVKVTIVELKGHQIRIGIDAPPEIRIYREEIYVQILEENRKAAEAASDTGNSLEGLSANWAGKSVEHSGPASAGDGGSDDESKPKKPSMSGLSAFTTSFGASSGTKPGEPKEGGTPQVFIKRKRKKFDE